MSTRIDDLMGRPPVPTVDLSWPEPDKRRHQRLRSAAWWAAGVLGMAALGVGMYVAITAGQRDDERRNEKSIAECVARGGQVVTDEGGWLDKCIGGTP